jgi:ribonuclease J
MRVCIHRGTREIGGTCVELERGFAYLAGPWPAAGRAGFDLGAAAVLTGARVIWSQWEGYLKQGSGAQLKTDCEARGIPFEIIHTSGHASITDLKRLAAAVNPTALVPIHTFEAERFPELFENVVLHHDGEWWEV